MTSRAAWTIVGLLWIVAVLNYLDRQLLVNMAAPVKADLAIADERFGLFSSMFLWVYGICSPLAGYLGDRVGRKPVIIASLVIWSLATLASGLVTSFEQMLLARACLGISEAFYMPAAVALIVDHHTTQTRSRATGLHLSGVYVGSILGGLGGWFAEEQGWRFGFIMFGSLGVAYALFLVIVLRVGDRVVDDEPRQHPERSRREALPATSLPQPLRSNPFRALLSSRGFVLLLVMNALNGAAYWPVRNWLPSFFNAELGVSLTWSGLYSTAAFNAAAFAGMLLGSTISDRLAARQPRVRALIPAVGFCLAAPCLVVLGLGVFIPVLVACIFVVGMSQGFLDANLMPAVCTVADVRHRATGYGLMNFVGTSAGGLMTYVGGRMKDAHIPFTDMFPFVAAMIFVAGMLLFAVRPTRQ
ncbi:MAG: MFS transporter [Gemmataceae bacterium]|nr:MFS transporter [Gemmata sp.]MDW8197069.1 MFS transporter [Gemmataceae bacterium]